MAFFPLQFNGIYFPKNVLKRILNVSPINLLLMMTKIQLPWLKQKTLLQTGRFWGPGKCSCCQPRPQIDGLYLYRYAIYTLQVSTNFRWRWDWIAYQLTIMFRTNLLMRFYKGVILIFYRIRKCLDVCNTILICTDQTLKDC